MKTISQKQKALEDNSYFVGKRDPKVRPGHAGSFMVADSLDPEGYAVVGDNMEDLIREAYGFLEDQWNLSGLGDCDVPAQALGAYVTQEYL